MALTKQAKKLWHTSNLYNIKPQEELAELICKNSFGKSVFFCNSGAEAVEGVIKIVRRYHYNKNSPKKNNILVPFKRPSYLCDDYSGTGPVMSHAVSWLEKKGIVSNEPCASMDIAPTLLDAIGVDLDKYSLDGKSLLEIEKGSPKDKERILFWEFLDIYAKLFFNWNFCK